jgi:hypothetical protein
MKKRLTNKLKRGVRSNFSPVLPAIRTKLISGVAYVDMAASDWYAFVLRLALTNFEYNANYVNAFEQYRCLSLTYHFIARNTVYQRDATGVVPPIMAVAPNFDDNTAPAASLQGLASVLMKPGSKVRHVCSPNEFTLTVVPRVLMDVENTAAVTADASKTWISCLDTASYLYGFKGIIKIDHQALAAMYAGTYWVSGVFEFRGQHAAQPGVVVPIDSSRYVKVEDVKRAGSLDGEEDEAYEYVRVKRK